MNAQVPRGIEVLVKKASIDPAFKATLLDRRAEAADAIGLQLAPAEAAMLAAAPRTHLETIITRAHVPQAHRRAFLGQAAAAMLAALGVVTLGSPASAGGFGNRPDGSEESEPWPSAPEDKEKIVEKRVLSVVAKQFKTSPKELKGDASLVQDLHATPAQLVAIKRQLEKQFKLSLPRKEFAKIRTVDDVVGCVKETVRRRDAANEEPPPNPPPNPTPNPTPRPMPTRGIQPDRPPVGGIRPDRPAIGGIAPR